MVTLDDTGAQDRAPAGGDHPVKLVVCLVIGVQVKAILKVVISWMTKSIMNLIVAQGAIGVYISYLIKGIFIVSQQQMRLDLKIMSYVRIFEAVPSIFRDTK